MLNRLRQKAISLLLSALVMVLGVVPPGVEHAHAGGGDPDHRHRKDVETVCSHSHDHHSHDHHSGEKHHKHEAPSDGVSLADSVFHLHWQFLGIDLSVPLSEKPTDQKDHEESFSSALLSVMRENVPVIQADTTLNRILLALTCEFSIAEMVSGQEPIPHCLGSVTAIPLCDSARFERSGVLRS